MISCSSSRQQHELLDSQQADNVSQQRGPMLQIVRSDPSAKQALKSCCIDGGVLHSRSKKYGAFAGARPPDSMHELQCHGECH